MRLRPIIVTYTILTLYRAHANMGHLLRNKKQNKSIRNVLKPVFQIFEAIELRIVNVQAFPLKYSWN